MPSLRRSLRLRLPVELWDAVDAAARAANLTPDVVIQRALRADLARTKPEQSQRRVRRRSR